MGLSRVAEVCLLAPKSGLHSGSGQSDVEVRFEDGGISSFLAATPDQPALWIQDGKRGWHFGSPVLFVGSLDRACVEKAVQAMAYDMGGYWLRYYNSPQVKKRARPASSQPKVISAAVTEAYPPRKPEHGCAAAQVMISDGREFSLLTATPAWFEQTFSEMGLPFYYGPSFLFVRKLDQALIRRVAKSMAEEGDRLFCLYDTPRRTLPEVLAQFKARHAGAEAG